ncbi:uncharacterized protein pdgfbb [Denticeps clupeoides]|uniref:Platelet-derived growth factor subunit B n=1 Tax=Denticeps clupeoides TaxID=299321 RepID=A0AAY4AP17_9TELE|nr:uncharacterized protein LOC114794133 [Denticeps clupeoides]
MMGAGAALLALLAACVRLSGGEGDPLPPALVELVRRSPISSIEDLQLLLLRDSEVPDSQPTDGHNSNNSYVRLPRSLDAQPAQQAQCKVRTEVMEVTRSMLDRSNANFLLWPPCVEVQRCSGCCNTKSLHCVPVLMHMRYLQVMRIQYINKRPHYDKAVVSVNDHVECRCQPVPRIPVGSRKKAASSRRQTPKERPVKAHSKEDLHRHDELKQNQHFQLDDLLLESHRHPQKNLSMAVERGLAQGIDGLEGFVIPVSDHQAEKGIDRNGDITAMHDDEKEAEGQHRDDKEREHHLLNINTTSEEPQRVEDTDCRYATVESHSHESSEVVANKTCAHVHDHKDEAHPRPEHRHEHNHSIDHQRNSLNDATRLSSTKPTDLTREHRLSPTQLAGLRPEPSPDPAKELSQSQQDNETPDSERKRLQILLQESEMLEEEKRELLMLHRRLDEEKEFLKQRQQKQKKEGEANMHSQPNHHTTLKPMAKTESIPSRSTAQPPPPQNPPSQPHPTRKRRKHRNRISKAAMRARLM